MTQEIDVRKAIFILINQGYKDKSKIYSNIVDKLGVPRPTVRRVARSLIMDLEYKLKILKGESAEMTIQGFEEYQKTKELDDINKELKKLETVTKAMTESDL